jgi:hypothetical protein
VPDETKPKTPRKQDPIRAAASKLADAKKAFETLQARVIRLRKQADEEEAKLPQAHEAVEFAAQELDALLNPKPSA